MTSKDKKAGVDKPRRAQVRKLSFASPADCLRSARLKTQRQKKQKGKNAMAIFYISDIYFSKRSQGQSSLSSAAYIEDRTLRDERIGKTFRYGSNSTKKHQTTILLGSRLPDGTPIETKTLWNMAEISETKSNARTSRHQWYALPIAPEIGEKERLAIAEEMRSFFEKRYGVATTAAIHLEHDNNPHLHLQWTVRVIEKDKNGQAVFKDKTRVLDEKKAGSIECKEICKAWEAACNKYLLPEHHIDHRSYKEQGLVKIPQKHIGSTAKRMEAEGKKSTRIEQNDMIIKHNQIIDKITSLQNELKAIESEKQAINDQSKIDNIFKELLENENVSARMESKNATGKDGSVKSHPAEAPQGDRRDQSRHQNDHGQSGNNQKITGDSSKDTERQLPRDMESPRHFGSTASGGISLESVDRESRRDRPRLDQSLEGSFLADCEKINKFSAEISARIQNHIIKKIMEFYHVDRKSERESKYANTEFEHQSRSDQRASDTARTQARM